MFRDRGEKDYYAILQVHPRAEPEVIEAAYRRLSRKHHPDVSGEAGSGQRMRDLNEAFEVLSDPARRRAYDSRRSFGGRPTTAPTPMGFEALLKAVPIYVGIAILVVLGMRLLPLLLRPQILVPLLLAIFLYFFFRRFRHH